MEGFLVKQENEWCVKWSDLHSFGYGTHWMFTKLSPDSNSIHYIKDEQIMYKPLEEDLKIQFEIITLGYNSENYTPIQTAKLMFPEVEIFKRIELIEKYKKINNVLWSIEKTSVMRDGTIMIIRPTLQNANQPLYIHNWFDHRYSVGYLQNANQPLYIHNSNWTIHNGYPTTNENLITNETERAYILDRLLQYKKHCQSEYNQIKTIIQNLKID